MSSCHPSTQRPLPAHPVLNRKARGTACSLQGRTLLTATTHPVLNPKRTLNAHVIIKVHEVGAP
jgi:hypothetical protein